MAGGKFAEYCPCLVCLSDANVFTKAHRTYEGDETDNYTCEEGHEFGMDFPDGPPTEAMWPPSSELQVLFKS